MWLRKLVPARSSRNWGIPEFAISHAEPPYAGSKIRQFTVGTYGNTTRLGSAMNQIWKPGQLVSNILVDDGSTWTASIGQKMLLKLCRFIYHV